MEEKLRSLASLMELDYDEVRAKYQEFIAQGLSENRAFRSTERVFKRIIGAPRKIGVYEGIIVGIGEVVDRFEQMRQRARREWEKDSEKAKLEGFCSEDGVPLDYRQTIFGRPNPNYGKPLEGSRIQRELYGICRKQGEDFAFHKLVAEGSVALGLKLPKSFEPVRFKVGERKNFLSVLEITKFEPLAVSFGDVTELVRKYVQTFQADQVEKMPELAIGGPERLPVALEGYVLTLNSAQEPYYLDLTTEKMKSYIRCFWRGEDNLSDIREDDEVTVIGRVRASPRGPGYVCFATGVYIRKRPEW